MRDEFDALFDRFLSRWPAPWGADDASAFWGFDVQDTDQEYVLRAEAPRFEVGDFDIQVSGGVLAIRAERRQESKDAQNGTSYSERRLHRTVTLPAGADPERVEAHYRNGVLELHFAKAPNAQGKRI